MTVVYLPDAKFTDNVGVHHVAISVKNGTELTWGEHNITYTASDKAGNEVTCIWSLGIVCKYRRILFIVISETRSCQYWMLETKALLFELSEVFQ